MYYIVNQEDDQILDFCEQAPDPKESANLFNCTIYIIEGEHTGLIASPSSSKSERLEILKETNPSHQEELRWWMKVHGMR